MAKIGVFIDFSVQNPVSGSGLFDESAKCIPTPAREGTFWRKITVGVIYLFIGGRMSLGATVRWSMGGLQKEFPRYDYRKLVWKEQGITHTGFEL